MGGILLLHRTYHFVLFLLLLHDGICNYAQEAKYLLPRILGMSIRQEICQSSTRNVIPFFHYISFRYELKMNNWRTWKMY